MSVLRYYHANLKLKVLLLQHKYTAIDWADSVSSALLSFPSFSDWWSVLMWRRHRRYLFYLTVVVTEDNSLTYVESFYTFPSFCFLLSWPLLHETFTQIMAVSNIGNNKQKYANMGTCRTLSLLAKKSVSL